MREIKFRGRNSKDNKTWFTGSLVSLTDIDEAYIDHYDRLRRVIERYPVNPATVGQFTGLLDSAGREIYEGDVVRIDDWSTPSYIRWDDVTASFVVDRWSVNLAHVAQIKFIGNVHDNPGLLEGENA